jgi:hypothetical protein
MTTSIPDLEKEIPAQSSGPGSASSSGSATRSETSHAQARRSDDGPLVLVPAGFFGDLLGGLSGTIGEVTGGFLGNASLGKQIGDAASPLVKLLPFQVIPPTIAPQSAGPEAARGTDETLVVVPAGFLGGIIGGLGGNLLGGAIGGLFGSSETGGSIGSSVGGVLGGLLPFQVVPPQLMPQSAGPETAPTQDDAMVVVPAGFFGDLLSGVAGSVGHLVAGDTGQKIGEAASPFLSLLPFQTVPPELAPQSAGPDGKEQAQDLVVLPAGFFGNLLSGFAETIGGKVGSLFGDEKTGQAVGSGVAPILSMLPFHAVPPGLVPQSAGPAVGRPQNEQMLFVPAGLFGGLLNAWGGTLGSTVGGFFGNKDAGKAVGDVAAAIGNLLPFSVVAPSHA